MQITKFYQYYFKKLFKGWMLYLNIAANVFLGWWTRKNIYWSMNEYTDFQGMGSITTGKVFSYWILAYLVISLLYYLTLGFPALSKIADELVNGPREDSEDALFAYYPSPTQRKSLVVSKFLAAFSFFLIANILFSLGALFWWVKNAKTSFDWLFIFSNLFLIPIVVFATLAAFFCYLSSSLKPKTARAINFYVVPLFNTLITALLFWLLRDFIVRIVKVFEKGNWEEALPTVIRDHSNWLILAIVIVGFLIGYVFYFLYNKRFQQKDISIT